MQAQDLAQRQAILAHPQLAVAGHFSVARRNLKLDIGRQVAARPHGLLHLVPAVARKGRPVELKGVAGVGEAVARLAAQDGHIFHGRQIGQEVALGGVAPGQVGALIPRAIAAAGAGLAAGNLHFETALGHEDAAAVFETVRPDFEVHGLAAQIGLAFQVDLLLLAAPPHIGERRLRHGDLDHIAGKVIAAALLGALPGRGHRAGGGSGSAGAASDALADGHQENPLMPTSKSTTAETAANRINSVFARRRNGRIIEFSFAQQVPLCPARAQAPFAGLQFRQDRAQALHERFTSASGSSIDHGFLAKLPRTQRETGFALRLSFFFVRAREKSRVYCTHARMP